MKNDHLKACAFLGCSEIYQNQ